MAQQANDPTTRPWEQDPLAPNTPPLVLHPRNFPEFQEAPWKLDPLDRPSFATEADGILAAAEAGWQESTTGLAGRMSNPDVVLSEDADIAERISYMLVRTFGDMPTLAAGFAAGAPAGAAVGGAVGTAAGPGGTVVGATAGAAIGGGAGAMGLTEGARALMMEMFNEGQSRNDILDIMAITAVATGKGMLIGGGTAGIGRFAGGQLAKSSMPKLAQTAGVTAAELTAMVSISRGLEGELPHMEDFVDGAILLAGFKGAGTVAQKAVPPIRQKLQDIYVKTGRRPQDVVRDAENNPAVLADMVSENVAVPAKYGVTPQPAIGPITKVVPLPRPEVKTPKPRSFEEAQDQVLGRIGKVEKDGKTLGETLDSFYAKTIDDLFPIRRITLELRKASGLPLPSAKKDPYILARLTRGMAGSAASRMREFRELVGDVKLNDLRAHMISARAVELAGRKIETGIPLDAARRVLKDASPEVKQAAQRAVEFQNTLAKELVDAGILSKEAFSLMTEANKNFVPFHRILETGPGGGKGRGLFQPIRTIKGSERKLLDPIEAIVGNTQAYTRMVAQNKATSALADMATGAGKEVSEMLGLRKVPAKARPVKVEQAEIRKFLKENDLPTDMAREFVIFRRHAEPLKPNQFVRFKEGKREVWEAPQHVADALRAMDPMLIPLWAKLLGAPASLLRSLTVVSVDFMVRNMARDAIIAGAYSKGGFVPALDFVRGFMSIAKKDKVYESWRRAGGDNTAILSSEQMLKDLFTTEMPRPWNRANPMRILRKASEMIENSPRVGEFKRMVNKGATVEEAAFASREVTLDFARRGGANARLMNQITAFWNVQIQGIDRMIRAMKDNPKGFMTRVALMVTLPSLALWTLNHDKEWYKEAKQWEKDLYWLVNVGSEDDPTILKIPKPHEIGILFGSTFERMLDSIVDHDPNGMSDFGETMWNQFVPDVTPTVVAPFVETWANKSLFTRAPVIPRRMENILPEYQFTEYTNPIAKTIGGLLGRTPLGETKAASPVVIEHFIGSWSGSLGRQIFSAMGKPLRQAPPTDTLADIPFIKAFFVRFPSASAASILDFEEKYFEADRVHKSLKASLDRFDLEGAERLLDRDIRWMLRLDSIHRDLGAMRAMVRDIHNLPGDEMSADEKRQLIDEIYLNMLFISQAGLESLEEMEKALKSQE